MNSSYWRGRMRGLQEAADIIRAAIGKGMPIDSAIGCAEDAACDIETYIGAADLGLLAMLLTNEELIRYPDLP